MAILSMHTVSKELGMTTFINMIIPDSVRMNGTPLSKRKVLYLLHGHSDDGSMFIRKSNIEVFAEKYGIVVVMPSADLSFYTDNYNGQNYYSYITKELREYMHDVFNLSLDKKDNMIAGISMGGYGAMRIGLLNSDNYFAVGSLSGVIDLAPLSFMMDRVSNVTAFKDLSIIDTDLNPSLCLSQAKDISVYVACGTEDDLFICSKLFVDKLEKTNLNHKISFSSGVHSWEFWDSKLKEFIDYTMSE